MVLMSVFSGCLSYSLWLIISTLTFDFFNKQFKSLALTTIHFNTCIVPQYIINNVILFYPLVVDPLFFYYHTHIVILGSTLSSDDSVVVLLIP